jgi:N-methylhydantoinase B
VGEWHSAGGIKFGSVEVAEVRFPLFFRSHEFRPDSGGEGEHRGGPGAVMDLVVEVPAVLNTAGDGARHGAAGIAGGRDGLPHDYSLLSGNSTRPLATKEVGVRVAAGDVIAVRSGGGGGWGDPARRSREARERDAALGLVDAAGAGTP